ncbi:MAG: 4-(cytidine 5'-diphospho)-2-C-methyl-D-erythritol kinase [Bacteroidales bacterium]|nr:4-(cytidine 5'-diphospho)-2-C-methyl-D-erythritol kinase [Bacteroidales bacterium]
MVTHPNVKVNLGLSVLRRRPDGYHDLETLSVPYPDICDTLEIVTGDRWSETSADLFARYQGPQLAQAISPDGKVMITIARAEGVDWDPCKDLTYKAYYLLSEDYPLPPVKIFLEKTAPVGAGLGGGSADAAFALRMYSELGCLGLTDRQLAAYAARLGSDCAFFIWNRPMLGEGLGEVLTPFGGLPAGYRIEVEVPDGIAVSTAEAYRGIRPRENADRPMPLRQVLARPVEEWKDLLVNDFEETVFAAHPQLAERKRQLYARGAVYAAMSGSGSALFGIFKEV